MSFADFSYIRTSSDFVSRSGSYLTKFWSEILATVIWKDMRTSSWFYFQNHFQAFTKTKFQMKYIQSSKQDLFSKFNFIHIKILLFIICNGKWNYSQLKFKHIRTKSQTYIVHEQYFLIKSTALGWTYINVFLNLSNPTYISNNINIFKSVNNKFAKM